MLPGLASDRPLWKLRTRFQLANAVWVWCRFLFICLFSWRLLICSLAGFSSSCMWLLCAAQLCLPRPCLAAGQPCAYLQPSLLQTSGDRLQQGSTEGRGEGIWLRLFAKSYYHSKVWVIATIYIHTHTNARSRCDLISKVSVCQKADCFQIPFPHAWAVKNIQCQWVEIWGTETGAGVYKK